MKKIAFLTFVVVFGNIFTFATPTEQEKNKLYVFPEKKEWKNLDTPQKRKEALQIPVNVLSQISTEELLDVCFDYPYLLAAQKDVKKQFNASQWQEIDSVRERLLTRDGGGPWTHFNLDGIVEYTPVNVYTPKRSLVSSTYRITGAEYLLPTEEQTATLSDFIYENYNCAELLSGEDFRYNCHAHAWHMTDGHMNDLIYMGVIRGDKTNIYQYGWLARRLLHH